MLKSTIIYILGMFKEKCRHEFYIEDLELTNIKLPEKPRKDDGYFAWRDYFQLRPIHDSHTKRIKCKCFKCENIKYAHCGLLLKGKLRTKPDESEI
jgi:hypothetical protein